MASIGSTKESAKGSTKGKRIVLCFDGTESKFGPDPYTNVLKLFRMLDKDSPDRQICYYQQGIGASMTVTTNTLWDLPFGVINALDSSIAFSLDQHIKQAYSFLMRFYTDGDEICLFGFSRGAFTARVLSSMIEHVGLLNAGLHELVDNAWSIYSAWEYSAQPSQPDYTTTLLEEFKRTFTRNTPPGIAFMGLFDTVNSVGLFIDRMFPFTTRLEQVKQIRHAVSLDERRAKYKQSLIYPYCYKPSFFSLKSTPIVCHSTMQQSRIQENPSVTKYVPSNKHTVYEAKRLMYDLERRLKEVAKWRAKDIHSSSTSTLEMNKSRLIRGEFQELWFPGNHGDVGGGWAPDVHGQFVSNLPLRWMLGEAVKHGVVFQQEAIVTFAERYSSLDSLLSPVHDVLSLWKHNLTLDMNENEKQIVLEVSKLLFNKRKIPDFRSCAVLEDRTYESLFKSGAYLTSLRRLKSDIQGPESIAAIFRYYQDLPLFPVACSDGRGDVSLLTTLAWWVIELVPLGTKIEDERGEWRKVYVPNLGRLRSVPPYAQMHWSILWRMRYCTDYKPANIPQYLADLLAGRAPTMEGDDYLLKSVVAMAERQILQWDSENWDVVPDDLDPVLRKAGYYH